MYNDVGAYVTSCELCQRMTRRHTGYAPMQSMKKLRPNQLVRMDLLGPFPESNGNHVILGLIDAFDSWVVLIPMKKDRTALDIASAVMEHWILEYGKMTALL